MFRLKRVGGGHDMKITDGQLMEILREERRSNGRPKSRPEENLFYGMVLKTRKAQKKKEIKLIKNLLKT